MLISVADAARALGVTRQRVHQVMRAMRLNPRRVGRLIVLSHADLKAIRAYRAVPRRLGRPPGSKNRKP